MPRDRWRGIVGYAAESSASPGARAGRCTTSSRGNVPCPLVRRLLAGGRRARRIVLKPSTTSGPKWCLPFATNPGADPGRTPRGPLI